MATRSPVRIVTLGAAFSANKGSASMLLAVIQNLPGYLGRCWFDVLTTYPREDAAEPHPDKVRLLPATPRLMLMMFPLALLAWLGRKLGLPVGMFCWTPAMRAIAHADVVVDIAGISFSDGRGIAPLGYNVIMTSIPLLLGRPVVKVAQALGTFEERLNRALAKAVLPHVVTVCARGAATEANLRGLGLDNVVRASDLAFTMESSPDALEQAAQRLGEAPGHRVPGLIAILPSAVVQAYCDRHDIDYPAMMARFVDRITRSGGHRLLILPHSARPGAPASHMNDLPVCRQIAALVENDEACELVDDNLPPDELRALIAAAEVTVTSRFHGMISSLATSTPVLVVGWSHKYQEVLDDLGLRDCCLDYSELSDDELAARFEDVLSRSAELRQTIERALPAVREASKASYVAVAAAAGIRA